MAISKLHLGDIATIQLQLKYKKQIRKRDKNCSQSYRKVGFADADRIFASMIKFISNQMLNKTKKILSKSKVFWVFLSYLLTNTAQNRKFLKAFVSDWSAGQKSWRSGLFSDSIFTHIRRTWNPGSFPSAAGATRKTLSVKCPLKAVPRSSSQLSSFTD